VITTTIAVLLVLLLGLAALLRVRKPPRYVRRPALMTAAERQFFHTLREALGSEYAIFAQVRAADVILPERTWRRAAWWKAFIKVSCKHVDFVLVDPDTAYIHAAVELDDRSHDTPERRERDALLDAAFKQAGVPLLRFRVRRSYDPDEVGDRIDAALAPSGA